jgi:1L-myo-inositol 1-phosphate cytidylyltransferase
MRVGGVPLAIRAVRGLHQAGCDEAVIVLGYESGRIQSTLEREYSGDIPLRFVINERYDLQNGVSVLAAEPWIRDQFVLVMADHLVSGDVMRLARDHEPPTGGATLLVDYRIDEVFDLDDATKVAEVDKRIVSIGKMISDYNCIDTGVFVCTRGLLDALSDQFRREGDASLSSGVQLLARKGLMSTLDIDGGFWQDVDTPEMLAFAESRIREISL